jgi:hypothetical protein
MSDERTTTGVRIALLSSAQWPDQPDTWKAAAVDEDANFEWFACTGATPLIAVTRLAEQMTQQYSDRSWGITDVVVPLEDLIKACKIVHESDGQRGMAALCAALAEVEPIIRSIPT